MDTAEPPLDGPGEESQLYCKPVAKKPKTAGAASSDDDSDDEAPAPAPEPIDVDADDASDDANDLDRFGPRTEVDLRLGDALGERGHHPIERARVGLAEAEVVNDVGSSKLNSRWLCGTSFEGSTPGIPD